MFFVCRNWGVLPILWVGLCWVAPSHGETHNSSLYEDEAREASSDEIDTSSFSPDGESALSEEEKIAQLVEEEFGQLLAQLKENALADEDLEKLTATLKALMSEQAEADGTMDVTALERARQLLADRIADLEAGGGSGEAVERLRQALDKAESWLEKARGQADPPAEKTEAPVSFKGLMDAFNKALDPGPTESGEGDAEELPTAASTWGGQLGRIGGGLVGGLVGFATGGLSGAILGGGLGTVAGGALGTQYDAVVDQGGNFEDFAKQVAAPVTGAFSSSGTASQKAINPNPKPTAQGLGRGASDTGPPVHASDDGLLGQGAATHRGIASATQTPAEIVSNPNVTQPAAQVQPSDLAVPTPPPRDIERFEPNLAKRPPRLSDVAATQAPPTMRQAGPPTEPEAKQSNAAIALPQGILGETTASLPTLLPPEANADKSTVSALGVTAEQGQGPGQGPNSSSFPASMPVYLAANSPTLGKDNPVPPAQRGMDSTQQPESSITPAQFTPEPVGRVKVEQVAYGGQGNKPKAASANTVATSGGSALDWSGAYSAPADTFGAGEKFEASSSEGGVSARLPTLNNDSRFQVDRFVNSLIETNPTAEARNDEGPLSMVESEKASTRAIASLSNLGFSNPSVKAAAEDAVTSAKQSLERIAESAVQAHNPPADLLRLLKNHAKDLYPTQRSTRVPASTTTATAPSRAVAAPTPSRDPFSIFFPRT